MPRLPESGTARAAAGQQERPRGDRNARSAEPAARAGNGAARRGVGRHKRRKHQLRKAAGDPGRGRAEALRGASAGKVIAV